MVSVENNLVDARDAYLAQPITYASYAVAFDAGWNAALAVPTGKAEAPSMEDVARIIGLDSNYDHDPNSDGFILNDERAAQAVIDRFFAAPVAPVAVQGEPWQHSELALAVRAVQRVTVDREAIIREVIDWFEGYEYVPGIRLVAPGIVTRAREHFGLPVEPDQPDEEGQNDDH